MNLTLKDIFFIIFRYKNGLLLFTLYLCLGLGLFIGFSKKMYESHAEILVRFGQEQLGSATLGSAERNVYFARREQEIQNEIRILTSNDTLMAAARAILGPEAPLRDVLRLRGYLGENLSTAALRNSDIVDVAFIYPDPLVAQRVLDVILGQYQIHHGAVYFDANELGLLAGNLEAAKAEYAAALAKVAEFEREHKLYDEQQIVAVNEIREQQQLQLNALINDYVYTQEKRDLTRQALEKLPENVLFSVREVLNVQHASLRERLSQALLERQSLLGRYTENSRMIQDLDQEIALMRTLLAQEPERLVDDKESRTNETWESLNRLLLDLVPEAEAQRVKIESLRTQIKEMEDDLARAIGARSDYALLKRDADLKKDIYDRYYQSYSEAVGRETAQQQSITNASVVERPSLNPLPVKPNKKRLLVLGAALLFAGNVFILFLSVIFDNTMSSPEQVERTLKHPVLTAFAARRRPSSGNGSSHSDDLKREFDETGTVPDFEGYRKDFRQLYLRTVQERKTLSLLFSSSERSREKLNLAREFAAFAHQYQQRRPAIIHYQPEDAAVHQEAPPRARREPARLVYDIPEYELHDNVDITQERQFWEEIKKNHDLLLFDYSPLQESPLLIGLADELNWVIYDIKAEKTNKYVATSAIETLTQFGFKKIGLVLSGREFHIPNFLYRYL